MGRHNRVVSLFVRSIMSLLPKTTAQTVIEISPQHKQLNRLIDQIEQQKLLLTAWQSAQDEIRAYSQKALMPAYRELYSTLYTQMQTLWTSLNQFDLNKTDLYTVERKIQNLAKLLKDSSMLNNEQLKQVDAMYAYFQQSAQLAQGKKKSKKNVVTELNIDVESEAMGEYVEDLNTEQYQQAREQAKLKRQQDKQAQAEKITTQSLKSVYLKIALIIHPDREPDEAKKIEKTELLQCANEAYEQEDLFYLLKLQLEVEQNKGDGKKSLTAEQMKFYQMALEAQYQNLKQQTQVLIDSLVWSDKAKIAVQKSKGQLNIQNLYKQIDADVSAVKQQLKAEKQRLSYMGREEGLEMLLEHQVL